MDDLKDWDPVMLVDYLGEAEADPDEGRLLAVRRRVVGRNRVVLGLGEPPIIDLRSR